MGYREVMQRVQSVNHGETMTHSSVGDLKDIRLSWRRFGVGLDLQELGSPSHNFELDTLLRRLVIGAEKQ